MYDRPDYGVSDGPRSRPSYSTERAIYRDRRDRDFRDSDFGNERGYRDRSYRDRASLERPVSHRVWRDDAPRGRDVERESPFYN